MGGWIRGWIAKGDEACTACCDVRASSIAVRQDSSRWLQIHPARSQRIYPISRCQPCELARCPLRVVAVARGCRVGQGLMGCDRCTHRSIHCFCGPHRGACNIWDFCLLPGVDSGYDEEHGVEGVCMVLYLVYWRQPRHLRPGEVRPPLPNQPMPPCIIFV